MVRNTCEQFHSEIKSDIGLERFPSGNFGTNAAILKMAVIAYNILRIVGLVVSHAGQQILKLGCSNIWREAFIKVHTAFL